MYKAKREERSKSAARKYIQGVKKMAYCWLIRNPEQP